MRAAQELAKYRKAGLSGLCRLLWRYLAAHLAPLPPEAPRPASDGLRLVVTLTSTPRRLPRIRPVLRSLLDQDRPPDEVVLALPERSRREGLDYRLPSFLRECGAVTSLRCERDWGPATKLIPALLRAGPEDLLLVVDDDNVYPPDLVSTLLRWHRRLPGAALGYRGWSVPPSRDWREARVRYGTALSEPLAVDVVTGTWGYLVRPGFFDQGVTHYTGYPEDAFYVDDVWINGHLARRGVPRLVVPARLPPLPTRSAWLGDLGSSENADGRRNNAVIRAFAESWGEVPRRPRENPGR